MANNTISTQKRGIFSAICNFLFDPATSQDIKQHKENTAILMQTKTCKNP